MRLSLLQKRGDIYHFRWTIPLDLRPILKRREITKSLKTSSKLTALTEAGELYSLVEQIVNFRRLFQLGKLSKETLEFQIQLIWSQVGQGLLRPPSDISSKAAKKHSRKQGKSLRALSVNPNASAKAHAFTKYAQSLDEKVVKVSFSKGVVNRKYRRMLGDLLEEAGLEFDDEDLAILVEQLIQAQTHYAQRMSEFLDVDKPIQPPVFVRPIAVSEKPITQDDSPLFSDFYERWFSAKVDNGLSEKIQKGYLRFHSDWIELMPDKPIAQYRKRDIRDFILTLTSMPKRNLGQYKGMSLSDLLDLEIPEEHKVAAKTADEVRKWLQGVFSLARTEEWVSTSPATDLKLNLDSSKPYGNFSDEQVSALLAGVEEQKDWKKWVMRIAAFSGMRRGEIAQLRKTDIKLDSSSNRSYFAVTDEGDGQSVKSEASKRKVPVHKQLETLGFLDFVDSCEDRLFPDVSPESITRWFNGGFKRDLQIPAFSESGQRLVFHSLRHSVITKTLSRNEMVLVQEVVGHEKQQMGVTGRYNHSRPLADLLPVIDCIRYS